MSTNPLPFPRALEGKTMSSRSDAMLIAEIASHAATEASNTVTRIANTAPDGMRGAAGFLACAMLKAKLETILAMGGPHAATMVEMARLDWQASLAKVQS